MLISIKEAANSVGRSGLIIRLAMFRDQTSSINEIEKPSWPRNNTSQSMTAPTKVPEIIASDERSSDRKS